MRDERSRMERWAEESPGRFGMALTGMVLGSLLTLAAILLGVGLILILANNHIFERLGRDSPWLALAVCFAFLGLALYGLRLSAGDTQLVRGPLVTFCIVAVVAAVFIWTSHDSAQSTIRDYCGYGARSEAQFDGCVSHVHFREIEHRHTNAARFARGEINHCLTDSGPLCARYASWRDVSYPEP
jgi:Ca2+/Na+ antiporter